MLILVSGCSGAGKNTVIKGLMKRRPEIKFLTSATTRAHREGESADAYRYLTKQQFEDLIHNNEMIEFEEIHGNLYGLPKGALEEVVRGAEDTCFIKDVGVLGQQSISAFMRGKAKVISVFLDVPRAELEKRLCGRGEKEIELRLSRVEFEKGFRGNFDEVICNTDLEKTILRLEEIIFSAPTEKK